MTAAMTASFVQNRWRWCARRWSDSASSSSEPGPERRLVDELEAARAEAEDAFDGGGVRGQTCPDLVETGRAVPAGKVELPGLLAGVEDEGEDDPGHGVGVGEVHVALGNAL